LSEHADDEAADEGGGTGDSEEVVCQIGRGVDDEGAVRGDVEEGDDVF